MLKVDAALQYPPYLEMHYLAVFRGAVATVWHKLYEVYLMSCVKNEKIKQNKMKKKSEFDQLIKR